MPTSYNNKICGHTPPKSHIFWLTRKRGKSNLWATGTKNKKNAYCPHNTNLAYVGNTPSENKNSS